MSLLFTALIVFVVISPSKADYSTGVCALPYCTCVPAAHPSWTTINCTVPHNQKLDILEGDLPESTTNLIITGAEAVMFGANALSRLRDARHMRVSDVRFLLMRKFTALNLNIVSLYLKIDHCDVLRFEEKTFSSIKGPLSVEILDCDTVSIEGAVFSWLLSLSICNVRRLQVGRESFMLDSTAANVGDHGPGMLIQLKNLTSAEFPAQTFGSSAAGITMDEIDVEVIRPGAFSANTYNIVMAINSSFHLIEEDAFCQKSLTNNLQLYRCTIHQFSSNALQSAVANLNISYCRFDYVQTGAINATVAAVAIQDNEFRKFMEKGFELSSWNKFQMERNVFDVLPPHAIIAPGVSIHELIFAKNEIETAYPESLAFIGQAYENSPTKVRYRNNYFGEPCHCNITAWLSKILDTNNLKKFKKDSYCTVEEFLARCFNVPDQNMVFEKFLEGVCGNQSTIQCEASKSKGDSKEIKNPKFPHKNKVDNGGFSGRNKKVIGIVIVTSVGSLVLALIISLIRWIKRKGYCMKVKNLLILSNSSCRSFCNRLCACDRNNGLDNARSISQLSVNEYSERHCLNEPHVQHGIQETTLPNIYTEQILLMDDKTTQTLPEELTEELLANLKEKLEDPENYVETREMIEHLYELIKVEESCNINTPIKRKKEENIYEQPFQNYAPQIGKNKKKMMSVGTKTPSLDKLTPLSPYNRQTALALEYFEPNDFAVHLYAEIVNSNEKNCNRFSAKPDVIVKNTNVRKPSNSPSKIVSRPLPMKPSMFDPGEGTSYKQ